jgi:hypothetical protein
MASILSKRARAGLVGLLVALLAMVGAVGPFVHDAQAGRIGPYGQAYVACDTFYHSMTVRPTFGPSPALSSQWLTYRYKIVDIDTGRVQWTNWAEPFSWSGVYVTGPITEFRTWAYVPERTYFPGLGRVWVYAQYAWYDGGWSYSPLVKTIGYEGFYFDGGGAYCRTVSVNG